MKKMIWINEADTSVFAEKLAEGGAFSIPDRWGGIYRVFPAELGTATVFYAVRLDGDGSTFDEDVDASLAAVAKGPEIYHMAYPGFEFPSLNVYPFEACIRAAQEAAVRYAKRLASGMPAEARTLQPYEDSFARKTAREYIFDGRQGKEAEAEIFGAIAHKVTTADALNDLCGLRSIRELAWADLAQDGRRFAIAARAAEMAEEPSLATEEWELRLSRALRDAQPGMKNLTAVLDDGRTEAKVSIDGLRDALGKRNGTLWLEGSPIGSPKTCAAADIKKLSWRGKTLYEA